jgi:hypothetical protein
MKTLVNTILAIFNLRFVTVPMHLKKHMLTRSSQTFLFVQGT